VLSFIIAVSLCSPGRSRPPPFIFSLVLSFVSLCCRAARARPSRRLRPPPRLHLRPASALRRVSTSGPPSPPAVPPPLARFRPPPPAPAPAIAALPPLVLLVTFLLLLFSPPPRCSFSPPTTATAVNAVIAASPTCFAIAALLPFRFLTCPRWTNVNKLYEHHEAIGGGAVARAPLRAAGRRCLPQLRMRLILFVLLAFGLSAGGWREPTPQGASGAVRLGPRAPPPPRRRRRHPARRLLLGPLAPRRCGLERLLRGGELRLRERSRPGNGWGMRAGGEVCGPKGWRPKLCLGTY
jgi:hypothetical protein